MQRVAFDRSVSDGFRTAKVESIVTTLQGRRLFVGTSDGFLTLYECRQDQSVGGRHCFFRLPRLLLLVTHRFFHCLLLLFVLDFFFNIQFQYSQCQRWCAFHVD
jgi:hypothetical protein